MMSGAAEDPLLPFLSSSLLTSSVRVMKQTLWEEFWQGKTHKYVETLRNSVLEKETQEPEA